MFALPSMIPAAHVVALAILGTLLYAPAAAESLLSNRISWISRTESNNVVSYSVLRGEQEDGPFSPIASVAAVAPGHQYEFIDDNILPGREYFYYLDARTQRGRLVTISPVMTSSPKSRIRETLAALGSLGVLGFVAILAILLAIARCLGTPRMVGDEAEYLHRAHRPDPFQPIRFARVPGYISLFYWTGRLTGDPGNAQAVITASGFLAVVVAVMLAPWVGGSALAAAAVCFVCIEFHAFALRLWPEPVLALCHMLVVGIIVFGDGSLLSAVSAGLVCAVAAHVRLEQVILGPAYLATLWFDGVFTIAAAIWVLSPTALGLALWTLRNYRKYRIAWPDTTWKFNLDIARLEDETPLGKTRIDSTVRGVVAHQDERIAIPRFNIVKAVPHAFLRILSFFGKDTFISQRLLPPGDGYVNPRGVPIFKFLLRFGFPIAACVTINLAAVVNVWPTYMLPGFIYVLASTLAHSRTRYRAILIPPMALWFSELWQGLETPLTGIVPGVLAGVILANLSVREES